MEENDKELIKKVIFSLANDIQRKKDLIENMTRDMNTVKKELRERMLQINEKKIHDDTIEVEIRERASFDMGILKIDFLELYDKFVKIEKKMIEVEEIDFDKEGLKKSHEKEYNQCLVKGTAGIYIKRG